jgi:hypothetical protein
MATRRTTMALRCLSLALNRRRLFLLVPFPLLLIWLLINFWTIKELGHDPFFVQNKYPLTWKHVHTSRGEGGGSSYYTLGMFKTAEYPYLILSYNSLLIYLSSVVYPPPLASTIG